MDEDVPLNDAAPAAAHTDVPMEDTVSSVARDESVDAPSSTADVKLTLPATLQNAEHESGLSFFRVRSQLQLAQQGAGSATVSSPAVKPEAQQASSSSTPASASSTATTPAPSSTRGSGRGRGAGRGGRGRGRARKESRLADPADDQWVQCDSCSKWRRVPADVPVDSLTSSEWTCSMATWDDAAASRGCDAPAEAADATTTAAVVETPMPVVASVEAASKDSAKPTSAAVSKKKPRKDSTADAVRASAPASSTGGGGKKKKKEIEWVQCENPECEKWRKLPPSIAASSLPSTWYCYMNHWDPSLASCDAPAEAADEEDEDGDAGETAEPSEAGRSGSGLVVLSSRSSDDGHSTPAGAPGSAAAVSSFARSSTTATGAVKKKRRGDTALLMEAAAVAASASPGSRGTLNSAASPLLASQRALGRSSSGGSGAGMYTAQVKVPFVDRRGMVPPAFVHGARDYHSMLLYHPAEVWAAPSAAGGVLADSVEAARAQVSSAGAGMQPTAVGTLKLSYRDLINASWGKAQKSSAHVHDRSVSAWESHLRWCRSSMYSAPASVLTEFGAAAMDVAAPAVNRSVESGRADDVLLATGQPAPHQAAAAAAVNAVTEHDLLQCPCDALRVALSHAAAVFGCAEPAEICRPAALAAVHPVLFSLLRDVHALERASTVAVDIPYAVSSDGMGAVGHRAWNSAAKPLAQGVLASVPGVIQSMRRDVSRWNTLSVVIGDGMARSASDAVNEALFARTRAQVTAKYDALRAADEAADEGMHLEAEGVDDARQQREAERQQSMDAEMAAAMEECNLQARTATWSSEPASSLDRPPYNVLTQHTVMERLLLLATLYCVVCITIARAAQASATNVPQRVQAALQACRESCATTSARAVAKVLSRARALLQRCDSALRAAQSVAVGADPLDEAATARRLEALTRLGLLKRVGGSDSMEGVSYAYAHEYDAFAASAAVDSSGVAMDEDTRSTVVAALQLLCSEAAMQAWASAERVHATEMREEHAPPDEDAVVLPLKLSKPWRRTMSSAL